MNVRRLITVACLSLIPLLIPASAVGSHDEWETRYPEVNWPWSPNPTHPDQTVLRIATEGRTTVYNIRAVMADIESKVAGIRFAAADKDCADFPRFNCLSIRVDNYGPTGWVGRTDSLSPTNRRILFNSHYSSQLDQQTACHELGHALGIMHHLDVGCVLSSHNTNPSRDYMSWPEIRALRGYYNNLG